MWLARTDNKIADPQRQDAEHEHDRRIRPTRPEWIVQLGIGTGRSPVQVHAGDRGRPVDRDEARRFPVSGLPACTHCQPDIELRTLGCQEALRSPVSARTRRAQTEPH
ncbi:DUF6233 domain-containing protein [Streptomyces sp. NPDC050416]|uniref:DUF6233 domain-containing protein n=1 Tax=Streptomyces sp. NPDC050416 TaxID=3365611 RepID=UPI0037987C62